MLEIGKKKRFEVAFRISIVVYRFLYTKTFKEWRGIAGAHKPMRLLIICLRQKIGAMTAEWEIVPSHVRPHIVVWCEFQWI